MRSRIICGGLILAISLGDTAISLAGNQSRSKELLQSPEPVSGLISDQSRENTDKPTGRAVLPAGVDLETGFRMGRYRAPVPDVMPGGMVVSTEALAAMVTNAEVIMIDVYPPRGLGADPLDGHWLITEKRQNISGSTWLPEVGRGYLGPEHEAYFRRNLDSLVASNPGKALVFYCTADCWQSWNAARRAFLWGYDNILWYPDGSDGWLDKGLELVDSTPINFLGE